MTAWVSVLLACTPPLPSVGDVLPAHGATGVPTNAAVVFESSVRDETVTAMVVLTSAMGGFSGPATLTSGDVFVFDPGADLAPGTWTATIRLEGPEGGGTRTVSFTTAAVPDTTPPVAGTSVEFDLGDYFDPAPFQDCPDPPPVYAVESDWEEATDGSAFVYAVRGLVTLDSRVVIGAPAGQTLSLEIFAIDAAGNISAMPVALLDVPGAPDDGGGGCSCRVGTGTRPPLAIVPLAAVLVALRRRRAR